MVLSEITERQHWMDSLRGLAIFLVVFGHAYAFGAQETGQTNQALYLFIETFAPFRIPAMVFLSGLLVPKSLAKGALAYLGGKSRTILYPYLLWSIIMLVVLAVSSYLIDGEFNNAYILRVFYSPIEHTWFLAYLFLYYLFALLLSRIMPYVSAAVFLFLAIVPLGYEWNKFWFLAAFFFLGVTAVHYGERLRRLHGSLVISGAMLLVSLAIFVVTALDGDSERYSVLFSPLVLIAILGAIGVVKRFESSKAWRPFRYMGRHSIVFYLVHWPVILVFDEIASKIASISLIQMVLGSASVALLISLAFARTTSSWKPAGLVFELPKGRRNRYSMDASPEPARRPVP